MLLRTRVTLIVSVTYSLLVAGLMFAGLKSEELANERYAQATLTGQEIFWRKLVENTVQKLEAETRILVAAPSVIEAMDRKDPSQVLAAVAPLAEDLRGRQILASLELVTRDGETIYSTRSLLDSSRLDASIARQILDKRTAVRGVVQDPERGFLATIATPLESRANVTGIALLGADLRPPLQEFKASTGADIYLLDHSGRMTMGTDPDLWTLFQGKVSPRKSRMETREEGGRFYSTVILPLYDGSGRGIGALVTLRDFTDTQARQNLIRKISMGAVVGFLALVLGLFTLYLRKSFRPLDEAITVLNALSAGDTSVTLEVRNEKDEIGRIAGTVGVFRENAVALERLQERRERSRRRQELFIRRQMQSLSDMLSEEARAAVLADLKQIEELASRAQGAKDQNGKGELEVLGVAFQTMSDRIRHQHESLRELIAERTKDVEILREALRTRDQLAVLRQELDFARELQLSSLPQTFPPFPERSEFDIHAAMVPAKEVGGDFYDFFMIDPNHLGFVIGDASGKGVPAAMFIAITRSLIKAVAPLSSSPGECLAFVNTMLAVDNPQTLFATCFYGVLETSSGQVKFCNAGHPPPLILRQGQTVQAIRDVSGVALGVMEDLEYETGNFSLAPGDTLLLYTDGVTEAQDRDERLYEESRLIQVMGNLGGLTPAQIIDKVRLEVEAFQGEAPQFDDITMLSLRFDHAGAVQALGPEHRHRMSLSGFVSQPAPPPAPQPIKVVVSNPQNAAQPKPDPAQPKPVTVKLKPVARPAPMPANAPSAAGSSPEAQPRIQAPAPGNVTQPQVKVRPTIKVTPAQPTAAAPAPTVQAPALPGGPGVRWQDPRHLAVTIANNVDELTRLAHLVESFVRINGLEDRINFNLNLCLDELITNIVSYGYDDNGHHDIAVRFSLEEGTLMCQIEDDAREYNPFAEAPEPDLDAGVDDRRIGGLGVFLVKEFMDRTEYRRHNGHNLVTLWKRP